MGRLSHKYITEEATCTYRSWSNHEILAFHYFNPNGLYQQWNRMCETGNQWVDAGHIRSGWVLAHGSLAYFSAENLVGLHGTKRVRNTQVTVALQMLKNDIDEGYERLAEMIMEG